MAAEEYVFWLRPAPTELPNVVFPCRINGEVLSVEGNPSLSVPISAISDVQVCRYGAGPGSIYYVQMATPSGELHLWPIDPMVPYVSRGYTAREAFALADVLETYVRRGVPHLAANPYIRQQQQDRRPKVDESLDANVSPMVYYAQGRLGWKPWQGWLLGVVVFVAFMLTAAIISLIVTPLVAP